MEVCKESITKLPSHKKSGIKGSWQRAMGKSSFLSVVALHMFVVVINSFFIYFLFVVLVRKAHCKFAIEEQVKMR